MKRNIFLYCLLFSFVAGAQDIDSTSHCKADFKYAVNPNIYTFAPATAIDFYDTSVGNVIAWFWDFGDNNTSTEQNPMSIFNHPLDGLGVKTDPFRTVRLTIITADSCKSTTSQTIDIMEVTGGEQQSCIAVFKCYESAIDTSAGTVTLGTTNYSEGEELSYFWQFGNGLTSTEKEPSAIFSQAQSEYNICLTVTGPDSCVSTMCQPFHVGYPVVTDTVKTDCYVDFGYDRKDILMSPLPSVLFDFYSKSDPEATEWYWDFGDGTTSNDPNPTHGYIQQIEVDSTFSDSVYYSYPSPYRTVCLTVKTADNCMGSICQTIQVFDYNPEPEPEKCQVYFNYYQPGDMVSIPEVVPIRLIDSSPGDVVSRLWELEDGTTSTEKELLFTFDIFQPVHRVCLTVTFADSCTNTFCDYVYVNGGIIDTLVVDPTCPYYIKVDGGFPVEMSSCAGWASAKVYLGEEMVVPDFISWSTGDTLSKIQGLCPMETYTVKALMPDGCAVWTNFTLSSDSSVSVISPGKWWLSRENGETYIRSDASTGMKVEWRLCDGTMVEADSISLDAINCGGNMSNMIVRDSMGNIVYSENISLKGSVTGIADLKVEPNVKLWPNPVSGKLNIRYSGEYQSEIRVEICDIMGKQVARELFYNIADGNEFSIGTEYLRPGIYICRVSANGKTLVSEKFSCQ